jgi:hypothetical protein
MDSIDKLSKIIEENVRYKLSEETRDLDYNLKMSKENLVSKYLFNFIFSDKDLLNKLHLYLKDNKIYLSVTIEELGRFQSYGFGDPKGEKLNLKIKNY